MNALPPKLRELVEVLERTRAATFALAARFSERDFARRPEGEWSAADILEHVILSETGTSKVIRKVLREKAGALPPYPADDSAIAVRSFAPSPGPVRGPASVQPPVAPRAKAEVLAALAACRVPTLESLAMLAGADPRAAEFPHPVFGPINLYEWPALTIGAHEREHQAQLADLLRAAGT